jgi:hypothetical protein
MVIVSIPVHLAVSFCILKILLTENNLFEQNEAGIPA